MCNDLSFMNTKQKTLKPAQKMFQFLGWMRKNFILGNFRWRLQVETWDAGCFQKKVYRKNICDISPLKNIFFQKLTYGFFKYPKSILVIPKILFILVFNNFNFSKLYDSPQQCFVTTKLNHYDLLWDSYQVCWKLEWYIGKLISENMEMPNILSLLDCIIGTVVLPNLTFMFAKIRYLHEV